MSGQRGPDPGTIEAVSERMLVIRFANAIDVASNERVHAAMRRLSGAGLPGIEDLVPAYATLGVAFEPHAWFDAADARSASVRLAAAVGECLSGTAADTPAASRHVELPVCYDESLAPDLAEASRHLGMSADELARRHAAGDYRVAMLGFAPGFPYLLGLEPGLHLPRRDQPRLRVDAGSVAIGGAQTGIYPDTLPGGWHLIGRTPWRLFDARCSPPNRLAAGDMVRFVAIGRAAFEQLDENAG